MNNNITFLFGAGECFIYKEQIKTMKPAGNLDNAFQSINLYSTDGRTYKEFKANGVNTSNITMIIQINPVKPLIIIKETQSCVYSAVDIHYHIARVFNRIDLDTQNCISYKTLRAGHRNIHKGNEIIERTKRGTHSAGYASYEDYSPNNPHQEESWEYTTQSPVVEPVEDAYHCAKQISDPITKLDNKILHINEETVRALKAYTSFILFGYDIPIPSNKWKILLLSGQIIKSTCPVNHFVISGILRIFKMFLLYSLENNPSSIRFKSLVQEERIISTLKNCRKSLPKLQLFGFQSRLYCHLVNESYTNITGQYIGKDGACQCLREATSALHGVHNIPITQLQNDHRLNYEKDFVMEIVWKMFLFTYYGCAEEFSRNPFDYGKFYLAIEEMFNDDLLFRWNNPGNSYWVYEIEFQAYDLQELASTIDSCVFVAHAGSSYPRWLQRPGNFRRKKRSFREMETGMTCRLPNKKE